MYASWNMECDRQNFCPFSTLTIQKNKIPKKWKKRQEILSFYKLYRKWRSYDVMYGSWDIWRDGQNVL